MARRPRITSFFRIPWRLQRLALEAGWELLKARAATLRPADHYTRLLGKLAEAPLNETGLVSPQQERMAVEIGAVVERAAKRMPFRALCLQQAIATRQMLDRRGLPATVYLGLVRDPSVRATMDEPAHAWVKTGQRIIVGDADLDRFAVVGTFA